MQILLRQFCTQWCTEGLGGHLVGTVLGKRGLLHRSFRTRLASFLQIEWSFAALTTGCDQAAASVAERGCMCLCSSCGVDYSILAIKTQTMAGKHCAFYLKHRSRFCCFCSLVGCQLPVYEVTDAKSLGRERFYSRERGHTQ
jgi:hypothetical protein